jgi:serine protease Do
MLARREIFELRTVVVALVALAVSGAHGVAGGQEPRQIVIKQPTGWFGVRISDQAMINEQGNAFFDSYPVITSVDSGSPAARAGVRPGDVLLTFNSHDMRGGSVELAKWLKVGAPFVLTIRRNDVRRVLRGKLARRPDNWEQKMIVELTVPEIMAGRSGTLSQPQQPQPGMMGVRERMPAPEPLPTVLSPALGYGGGVYPFAGAEFTQLTADLCDALGVKAEGVFVTNVIDDSPARNAGLRGGDIVLKADDARLVSPIDLVQAIKSADETDRTIVLQIMRKRKLQTLTLRW